MCIALHFLEFVIQPPARYPDLFPVLNVLISTPVFGLVWLWSIKSGIEAWWAVGAAIRWLPIPVQARNPFSPPRIQTSRTSPPGRCLIFTQSTTVIQGPRFSATDSPLSPLHAFNRKIGSPPAMLGPHRPGVKERTWSNASANSNVGTRGTLPVGPGWDRPLNLEGTEGADGGGETPIQGPKLNVDLGGQGQNPSDRRRSRGQSLDASTFPGSVEGPPLSID